MPSVVTIKYSNTVSPANPDTEGVLVIGKHNELIKLRDDVSVISAKFGKAIDEKTFIKGLDQLFTTSSDSVELYFKNFTIASMPSTSSRHNAPMLPHTLSTLVKTYVPRTSNEHIVIVCERESAFALGCAVPRVFPLYNTKTGSNDNDVTITVEFVFIGADKSPLQDDEVDCLHAASQSVRLAAKIVDIPCNEMHTDAFLEEIRTVGREVNIEPFIIQGEELNTKGFGGIYGVGKAAIHLPALAVLSYKPEGATKNIAWCGKGIVYDTGGLSIKDKNSMPGMKRDCGGAAAILGAFRAAVKAGFKENLHAVFCLAENAVGPLATRPDDIHTLYSGLTVEINNTDAEGRLVLGDGVAYAKKDLKADIIVDMATLTGAQGIATGAYHAAILTNNEDCETSCSKAGRISGDLVFPVPYTPELHFEEFTSCVADMKNSVKNRSNAQVSCAGLFIGSHIGFSCPISWLHIDMAGPVKKNERATGYGVALLLALFGKYTSNSMLMSIGTMQ